MHEWPSAFATADDNQNRDPAHTLHIEPDTLLARLFGTDRLPVNSFHHQAVREPAPGFRVSGRAADGIIEAVESAEHKSMLCGSGTHRSGAP